MTMDAQLRKICLCIAAIGAAVALISVLIPSVRLMLSPTTIIVSGTAVFLFIRMLASGTYRDGINAANVEMQGNDPWPGRPKKFGDPDWGLFGVKTGSPALLWLRAILVIGILPIALLQNWIGIDVVWPWVASAFVAMELSLMHVALSQSLGAGE